MRDDEPHRLDLLELGEGIPALTAAVGGAMVEACLMCFDDQRHRVGVELKVNGTFVEAFTIHWQGDVTEQMRRCWKDETVTTEQAACGIALLLIRELTGYTAIERASKGPGFDYWIGTYNEEAELPFDYRARLEVSGIRSGNEDLIKRRVSIKKKQTNPSDGTLPAFIIVVEFSAPRSYVVRK